MWVYGDRERTESTREFLQELLALGEEIGAALPGLRREGCEPPDFDTFQRIAYRHLATS